MLEDVDMSVSEDDLVPFSINADTVSRSVSQLKPRKSNGKSLMSDHVLFAPPILASKLAGPFTALIHQAQCIRDSIIQPFPKDLAKSANYRGIVLASCFSKLLELCILIIDVSSILLVSNSALKKVSLQIYGPEL